jgi:hypothetical protein
MAGTVVASLILVSGQAVVSASDDECGKKKQFQ